MPTQDRFITHETTFIHEFSDLVETRRVMAGATTKIKARAKYINSPFMGHDAAKNHTSPCVVPVGQFTVGRDELIVDRYTGLAYDTCKEVLTWANFNQTEMARKGLYRSVMAKLNENEVADIVASATAGAGTTDLSTRDGVTKFLLGVQATYNQVVTTHKEVENGSVISAEYEGMPVVYAGPEAFVQIGCQVTSILSQSSTGSTTNGYGNVMEAYGVKIINLGSAAQNPKQLLYGLGGVPVFAYRSDAGPEGMEVYMGDITGFTTAAAADLDVAAGDRMFSKTYVMSAQTRSKSGIFADNMDLFIADTAV